MWSRLVYGGKDLPFNFSKFICDTVSDLTELPTNNSPSSTKKDIKPCSVGSIAVVVADKNIYILNNQNEWKLYKSEDIEDALNTDKATINEFKNYIGI